MNKKSKYIPPKKLNPVQHARRIEKLDKALENLQKTIDALSKSHDVHISYLANFARHDIKNSIQSMDSILSTNSLEELTEDHLLSLKTNLKVIRETMDNFSKLVPYSQDETFSLKSLITAIELLNRSIFFEKKIIFKKELPKDIEVRFKLPFQSVLQMFNNIIINAIKSLNHAELPEILLQAFVNESIEITIFDNGENISDENADKIFDFGYSTTGGSGIGLYHAKYLCELFKGEIRLTNEKDGKFTKAFTISLPIRNIHEI